MATVIKAGEAGSVMQRLSTVDLADHFREARRVVEEAQREAERILAEARMRSEYGRDEAKRAGHEAGYAEGYQLGVRAGHKAAHEEALDRFGHEHANVVAAMNHAIGELQRIRMDLRIEAEKHLLDFAVRLAGKLTLAIGRRYPDAALHNFRRALDLVGSMSDLTVRVHPEDHAAIETFAVSVLRAAEESRTIHIVADDSIARGGCLVETSRTRVDATLETQMEEMAALLLGDADRGRRSAARSAESMPGTDDAEGHSLGGREGDRDA